MSRDKLFSIVITGGIASGKSLFCSILEENGFDVFYADKMAHRVLKNDNVIKILVKHFGDCILTNLQINRKKLGKIVFGDSDELAFLDSIVHPEVQKMQSKILADNNGLIFFEIPLLFEINLQKNFDYVVYISTKPQIQIDRIKKRDNFSESAAIKRVNSQISDIEKRKLADMIIDNNLTIDKFKKKADNFVRLIKN